MHNKLVEIASACIEEIKNMPLNAIEGEANRARFHILNGKWNADSEKHYTNHTLNGNGRRSRNSFYAGQYDKNYVMETLCKWFERVYRLGDNAMITI
jgi:hypothetical protein